MEEAVEICKLRLFLKLVAQLETYEQIEPLPDIDFNIRAGNTLVGFTSLDAVRDAMTLAPNGQHRMLSEEDQRTLARINEDAEIASAKFNQFRWQQTMFGGEVTAEDKANLRNDLESLSNKLARYLAKEYGVDLTDSDAYDSWRISHHPFHWFVEFYEIMNKGGFDVVVGNPPYVEYRTVKNEYSVRGFRTEQCGNLYAMTWERSIHLAANGRLGMIVPASAVCTDGYAPLRELLMEASDLVVSSYSDNPGKLFDGMPHNRLQIILANTGARSRRAFATAYNKWRPDARQYLFQNLTFFESTNLKNNAGIAKISYAIEASILRKNKCRPVSLAADKGPPHVHSVLHEKTQPLPTNIEFHSHNF